MRIIYISKGVSPTRFKYYYERYNGRLQYQAQKYNQLLMEGFVFNGEQVVSVSSRPINRSIDKKVFFGKERETEVGIEYKYVSFINFPILRNISVFLGIFFTLLCIRKEKSENAIICDALNIAGSAAALIVSKLCRITCTGIVTDVPCHRPINQKNSPFHEHINLWMMRYFDNYLLLTVQMNDIVNPKRKPYIVLEGHTDVKMIYVENNMKDKYLNKVCMYAGSLREIYGIRNLVEGFLAARIPDCELHIYGSGDYEDELKKVCDTYKNVKYFGNAPNDVIMTSEIKSSLLINPRPVQGDYTKYSFPSKNLEYMSSGTPVLTTHLPGMPLEYEEYVFLITDDTAEGICAALRNILVMTPIALHNKGCAAKEFVIKEKNNVIQARKVLGMMGENNANKATIRK